MKKTSRKTPKVGQKVTIKPRKKGQKKLTYVKGGLHESLGLPQGTKIPKVAIDRAIAGHYGPKAKKQAMMARNVFGVQGK